MAQSDNHPDPKTRKGQKHRQELAPHMSNVHSGKNSGKSRYAEACDEYLAEAGETRTVEQADRIFKEAVNKASGLFIPAGRIQHFQPTLPASAKSLSDELDRKP